MNEQLNVTGVGIAVALAVIIAGSLLFFGPAIFTIFNPAATQTTATNATSTMQDQIGTNTTALSASDINIADIPANVTELMGKEITVGTGAEAKAGDTVTVHYIGMLTNGQVFDASANHGDEGFTFPLGAQKVIKGWDQGVVGMKVGGKRELIIPASLAYGSQAMGSIPANSTLVFAIQLVNVTPGQ